MPAHLQIPNLCFSSDLIGGLLNATFGNAVEMILTVQALKAVMHSVTHSLTYA